MSVLGETQDTNPEAVNLDLVEDMVRSQLIELDVFGQRAFRHEWLKQGVYNTKARTLGRLCNLVRYFTVTRSTFLRVWVQLLVLLEHQEVLVPQISDGALVSWAGFAAHLFRTQTVTMSLAGSSLPELDSSSAASPSDLDPDPAFSYKSYVLPLQLKEKVADMISRRLMLALINAISPKSFFLQEETRLSETTQIASYHFAKSLISTTSQDALCLDRSFSLCTAPGCMRQSCALIEKEAEVEEIFVVSCRREGAVHQAYLPIVAASRRAATLHYCCNDREFTTEVLIQSIANGPSTRSALRPSPLSRIGSSVRETVGCLNSNFTQGTECRVP
ncbi:uncharacterized protein EDB93DRAFT_1109382 [Suillus bovinus]|uniref:uncharacterized protein n=1 Tax=Suillus bovinus TaxID=48563 RepID=UPI001B87DBDD|nr:uncharacterized protein EDB93DRAFT_1109382 [Suillus bovinus]KAG2127197.1 hypothetical protein EDB93DRAFT_1109382 [Suillus bovinus]